MTGLLSALSKAGRGYAKKFDPIPVVPPRNLRERYSTALMRASGGKDPQRIKLTPPRMEAAKEHINSEFSKELLRDAPAEEWRKLKAQNAQPTKQMIEAQLFASEAARRGEKVSFRMPDGPSGSLYVRVGDKGTVRFSDHAQPMGYDDAGNSVPVGGYSSKLGRRHGVATISSDPQTGFTSSDAISRMLKLFAPIGLTGILGSLMGDNRERQ